MKTLHKNFKFTYQSNDIEFEKNDDEKYWIKIIKNNKLFIVDKMFEKSYAKSNLYYLIHWKNYIEKIWKSIFDIKYLRNMFKKFHFNNSIKLNVNKEKNHRRFNKIKNFMTKILTKKSITSNDNFFKIDIIF